MPTQVFIVRPFGEKEGIDFDRIEAEIIAPVLDERPDTAWGTTGEIVRSGNIRADMMDLLLTADLVIADISIHNANVYYELGVRHALRHRPTILMRSRVHDVPFDLKTDRYLSYDPAQPEAAQDALRETIAATLSSDNADSPVYQLLPGLEARDGSSYIALPREFAEAVELARRNEMVGQLGLLGDEARVERWHVSGQRLVGRALSGLAANRSAQVAWERIRQERPDDTEANLMLATIYQRRGDLPRSEAALERVLAAANLSSTDRAEALGLRGRNIKSQWTAEWREIDDLAERQRVALSSRLVDGVTAYRSGFLEDINHHYPGVNALALSTMVVELAELHPEVWDSRFDAEGESATELRRERNRRDQLAAATALAITAAEAAVKRKGHVDPWLSFTIADHRFLTSERLGFVAGGYQDAAARAGENFSKDAAAAQIALFRDLGLFEEKAQVALDALGLPDGPAPSAGAGPRARILVSSGHRIDQPGRPKDRFPATDEAEAAARAAIRAAIEDEQSFADGPITGMSGLANGSDILFHEVAAELGVETQAVLALPENEYMMRSVGEAGNWAERYRRLLTDLVPLTLADGKPSWVSGADEHYVFQRCNMWLMEKAFAVDNADVTLIALWNGAVGDGPGGTADMVALARERGAKVRIIDTNELFGLT